MAGRPIGRGGSTLTSCRSRSLAWAPFRVRFNRSSRNFFLRCRYPTLVGGRTFRLDLFKPNPEGGVEPPTSPFQVEMALLPSSIRIRS